MNFYGCNIFIRRIQKALSKIIEKYRLHRLQSIGLLHRNGAPNLVSCLGNGVNTGTNGCIY